MTFQIRPVRTSDAAQINAIRRQAGVYPNMLSLPSERPDRSERFLANLSENDHVFVAVSSEDDSKVLGIAGVHIQANLRMRHIGSIGISVHENHQGKASAKR